MRKRKLRGKDSRGVFGVCRAVPPAEAGITALPAAGAKALIGKGVEAVVGGQAAWVASPRFASDKEALNSVGIRRAAALEEEGKTVVVAFREGRRP